MTTYTVKGGDTLSLIAERALGDMSRWPEIASLNKISTPNLILPGQVLQLPDPAGSLNTSAPQEPQPTPGKSKWMSVVVISVLVILVAGYLLYRYSR